MPPLLKLPSFKTLIHPIHHHFHHRTTAAPARSPPSITTTPRAALSAHDKAVKLGFCSLKSCCKRGEVDSSGDMSVIEENECSVKSNLLVNGAVEVSKQAVSKHQTTKLLTLPTVLTIARVVAVPVLICTFYMNSWWGTTATTCIFIAAAITDWLDGYLARRMKLGSAFGAFLDPVADKLMVAATLVLLCTRPPEVAIFGQFPWLLTVPSIAIIGREITMSAVREWAASQSSNLSEAVAVNNLGKWKTAAQMTALTILLVTRDSSFTGPGVLINFGVALLYISAWLAVWSLVVYMKKIWKVLLM
ncbi:Cardiolipin synthase (CMP-forming), mitochondrial [Heracleum sosnowskyi]|uniref:CDP-diacylglycerol--glycerol-3-phosphate 1-phosphatidyltransferase n=1 Tax=Heracleum sosnowskyi TaxID=360622 RepID=A0AAD8M0V4_9APIA|nr:Cardiolipin synthase (CMP-forming), mitochondrial [Heracleum sosnowskyi]